MDKRINNITLFKSIEELTSFLVKIHPISSFSKYYDKNDIFKINTIYKGARYSVLPDMIYKRLLLTYASILFEMYPKEFFNAYKAEYGYQGEIVLGTRKVKDIVPNKLPTRVIEWIKSSIIQELMTIFIEDYIKVTPNSGSYFYNFYADGSNYEISIDIKNYENFMAFRVINGPYSLLVRNVGLIEISPKMIKTLCHNKVFKYSGPIYKQDDLTIPVFKSKFISTLSSITILPSHIESEELVNKNYIKYPTLKNLPVGLMLNLGGMSDYAYNSNIVIKMYGVDKKSLFNPYDPIYVIDVDKYSNLDLAYKINRYLKFLKK